MHSQTVLVVAVSAITGAFVPIVLVARWLESTGRLGDPERRVRFAVYGPVIAGALSLGALAVHLSVIGVHAAQTAPSSDAVLFLCAIGAATAHPATVDAKVLGFLPVGVASLVVTPLQGLWAWPRTWRRHGAAIAGVLVALVAVGISITQLAMQPLLAGPTFVVDRIGEVGVLALLAEGLALVAVAVLLLGRPRRVVAALELRAIDAFVATSLAVVAVGVVSVVGLAAGHAAH